MRATGVPALTHLFLRRYEGRYGRSGEGGYGGDYGDYDAEGGSRAGQVRSKYRSRFRRDAQDAAEPEPDTGRNVRFQEQQNREPRVLDTEDVSKGEYQGVCVVAWRGGRRRHPAVLRVGRQLEAKVVAAPRQAGVSVRCRGRRADPPSPVKLARCRMGCLPSPGPPPGCK